MRTQRAIVDPGRNDVAPVAARLLAKGPMTLMELVIGVLHAGYSTTMSKRALRSSIRRELNAGKDVRQSGEKWAVG